MAKSPLPIVRNGLHCGQAGPAPPLRASRRWKWRALTLIGVHILFVAHFVQWKLTGKTLTPVEPSEAMQTLELGYVNAGFLLFLSLILATLVFGRFFCGWGCHIVFLQDVCGWALKKLGIRPKPFRSRLLIWVPVFAALYMFVWPQALRIWEGRPLPEFAYHLTTEDFWATFPGPGMAILTFAVCGFLIVALFGNKGFCTYGCPYGAFFYNADRFATGKIRVTDACNQCGHCTATCSSNVRVHEEVALYGMVVDPGCMKCLDCVDVCPNRALYFGFGKPALGVKRSGTRPRTQYDFSVREELALALLFAWSFYSFRGLYNSVPFLLSLGLSGISAYAVLLGIRLAYSPSQRLFRWQMKSGGSLRRAGWVFASFAVALAAFLAHASLLQFHVHRANASLARVQAFVESGVGSQEGADALARASRQDLLWATRAGWFGVDDWQIKLGSLELFLGNDEAAGRRFRAALRLNPDANSARIRLAEIAARAGRWSEAVAWCDQVLERTASIPMAHALKASALAAAGRHAEALPSYKRAVSALPANWSLKVEYGQALAACGLLADAERVLREAVELSDSEPAALLVLAETLSRRGARATALSLAREAITVRRPSAGNLVTAAGIALAAGDLPLASEWAEAARLAAPFAEEALVIWTKVQMNAGTARQTLRTLVRKPSSDDASWFAAAHLYEALGDKQTARILYERVRARLKPGAR